MVRDESRTDEQMTAELARDAAPRRGKRVSGGGDAASADDAACGTETADEKPKFRIFNGDRVLWIIIATLAVISVLVVYSSTAKMAYDAHTARTTAHFLRQQLMILVFSLVIMVAVQKINCRIYNLLARPVYFLSVAMTIAVYFIGATTNGAARWIPLGPFQFQPSEALKVATVLFLAQQLAGRQSKIDKIRPAGSSGRGVRRPNSGKSGAKEPGRFCCRSPFRPW